MKKIMIIGGGHGQMPLIKLAKQTGLFIVVVSPMGNYPGIALADKLIEEDVFDKERILEIAQAERIDCVLSDQSDFTVPTVAYIAEKMGLNGNRFETATFYTNKFLQRTLCEKIGVPTPQFTKIKAGDIESRKCLDAVNVPVIVKPVDSQGSRGVEKVDDTSLLPAACKRACAYSKNGEVIVEEFVMGREVVCEGFVLDGKYHNVAFGDRYYFDLENKFIPSRTVFPSTIPKNVKAKITEYESKICEHTKASFGTTHSEYLIDERDGRIVLVETALRGGGVYIASDLIPLSTGVDLTAVLLNAMLGNRDTVTNMLNGRGDKKVAAYICFYLKEGIVSKVYGLEKLKSDPRVKLAEVDEITEGYKAPVFEHKGMRKGPILVVADDLNDLDRLIQMIKESYGVEIDGKPGVVWD